MSRGASGTAFGFSLILTASLLLSGEPVWAERGEVLYRKLCVECHGPRGEGVDSEYAEPLYGDLPVPELARVIHETMPEGDPEACVDADALAVARYVHETFYSAEARAQNQSARVELARLTADQYQQTVADLFAGFGNRGRVGEDRGLLGRYFNDRRADREKLSFERVDPEIRFDFGVEGPEPESMDAEAFSVQWDGALLVERTGVYEFCVKTENGFKLFVNGGRRGEPLIDGWVSSGMLEEKRASLTLLGGRVYPLRLEYFKYKDKWASLELRWRPPGGVETVIPREHLAPERVPEVVVVQTSFPADDRSLGYVRGASVSKAWHEATTAAAIEVADHVASSLGRLTGTRDDEDPAIFRRAAIDWLTLFVERAFRRPLSEAERAFFIMDRFGEGVTVEEAAKRVVLLALKSPRFLFPEPATASHPHHQVAARLALALWDSVPDEALRRAAAEGRLGTWEQVEEQARRMLADERTRFKLKGFFDHWLHLDEEHDVSKDPALFPGFDAAMIQDWRRSLNLFIEGIMWDGSADYRELLLANYLPLNGRLASFLGHGADWDEEYRPVFFDPRTRAGVLTHPYVLARHSYHRSTSPIHRGVFLTRNVLGRSLKPPPEAVQFEESRFDPHLTMREKVTELTKAASCMGCHAVINPLGFSLENFDAVGRYRFEDRERPIDPASLFTTVTGEEIRLQGARDVARHAAESPAAQRAFVQHLFEHLVKQPVPAYGGAALDHLHDFFLAAGFNIQELMIEMVTLACFQQQGHPLNPTSNLHGAKHDQDDEST